MTCGSCGAVGPDVAKFCTTCGASQTFEDEVSVARRAVASTAPPWVAGAGHRLPPKTSPRPVRRRWLIVAVLLTTLCVVAASALAATRLLTTAKQGEETPPASTSVEAPTERGEVASLGFHGVRVTIRTGGGALGLVYWKPTRALLRGYTSIMDAVLVLDVAGDEPESVGGPIFPVNGPGPDDARFFQGTAVTLDGMTAVTRKSAVYLETMTPSEVTAAEQEVRYESVGGSGAAR